MNSKTQTNSPSANPYVELTLINVLFSLIICVPSLSFAQRSCPFEYYVSTEDIPGYLTYHYYAIAQGTVWKSTDSIATDYDDTLNFSYTGDVDEGGWNRDDSDDCPNPPSPCPEKYGGALGRGLYKIYVSSNPPIPIGNIEFYLDTRDCGIPDSYEGTVGHDINFKYYRDDYE